MMTATRRRGRRRLRQAADRCGAKSDARLLDKLPTILQVAESLKRFFCIYICHQRLTFASSRFNRLWAIIVQAANSTRRSKSALARSGESASVIALS